MDALPPPSSQHPVQRSRHLLGQIAKALGVGADSFDQSEVDYLFHIAEDGTKWFLTSSARGKPLVRRIGRISVDRSAADEPIAQFLWQHRQTPQGQALEALISRLLLAHLR